MSHYYTNHDPTAEESMPRLVARQIASALRQRIDAGEWQDAGRMPPERELAQEFGVARNTVRRAVGLLAEDGAITRHVGRGTFLAQSQAGSFAAIITRLEGASPADMMEIRQLLEPATAAFAAVNATSAELNAVRLAHQAASAALDMPLFERHDAEFHNRIFACSRNEFLKEIHNLLGLLRNQAPWFEMKRRSFSEARRQIYCQQHQAILDALLKRDSESARAAMLAHLETVAKNLLGR